MAKTIRLNETALRRVIRKIVSEQAGRAGGYGLDSAFSDFVSASGMGGSTDVMRKAAAVIRKSTSKDQFGWQEISDGLVNAGMDEADAEEFAFGIQRGDY